jgi:broad specificity polyphosphatase/5'/3'-nucleotidase SurE
VLKEGALFEELADLFISGINDGIHVGDQVPFSGAVGAAIVAANYGVPGIVVNSDPPPGAGTEEVSAHYNRVVSFVLGLVARLQSNPGFWEDEPPQDEPPLLPRGTLLNINYPWLGPDETGEVEVSRLGRGSPSSFAYLGDGELMTDSGPAIEFDHAQDSDIAHLAAGDISVAPMELDWTAPQDIRDAVSDLLDGLFPDQETDVEILIHSVKDQTVSGLLDQADALIEGDYLVAAAVLAGGALETHLRHLCDRHGITWEGEGSIGAYDRAIAQERDQGGQEIYSAADSKSVSAWSAMRDEAAYEPSRFERTAEEVRGMIRDIRQFVSKTG